MIQVHVLMSSNTICLSVLGSVRWLASRRVAVIVASVVVSHVLVVLVIVVVVRVLEMRLFLLVHGVVVVALRS